MKEIVLGSEVIDEVTGFKGKVTSRATHLNGCDRYWVQPPIQKDGKYPDGAWIDVTTLKVTKAAKVKVEENSSKAKPGGFPSRIK